MCSSVPKAWVPSYAFLNSKEFESKADYEGGIVELLDEHEIDLVCLAGYMKIVGPTLLAAMKAVSLIFTRLIFLNFQVLMVLRMLGMQALLRAV